MTSTAIDSTFLKDLYGTPEMRAIFNDMNLLQKWLDVEAALAQAEAELGLIPSIAADEIRREAKAANLSPEVIKRGIDDTVHPIVPVIRGLQTVCRGDAGEYIHWGATTQDIMDTAMVLQLKEALPTLEMRLRALMRSLETLTRNHRDTLMPGRTHGQQALPITLGYKTAIWLAEFQRHLERLEELKPRLLVGQLGGASGTLASLPELGFEVQSRMMEILGLSVPLITWHTARDSFAEFTSLTGMIAATAGKIAHEIITLQRTELGEVAEPFHPGKVGSSTMPHKRNPMLCEAILALARLVMRSVPLALDAMLQENERDWSCDHIEWAYLGEVSIYTDGALNLLRRVLDGLTINPERMRQNLELTGGLILSEAVMLELSSHVGRQTAHEWVYQCAMQSYEQNRPFREILSHEPRVNQFISVEKLDRLLDPQRYTGLAGAMVDRVLRVLRQVRSTDLGPI